MGRRTKVPLPVTGKYRLFNLPVVDFGNLPTTTAATRKRDSPDKDEALEGEWVSSDSTSSGSDSDVKIVSPVATRSKSKKSKSSFGSGSSGSGRSIAAARKRLHANQKYDGPALRLGAEVSDDSDGDSPVKLRIELLPAFVAWDKERTAALSSSKKSKPGNRLIRSEWFASHSTFHALCLGIM